MHRLPWRLTATLILLVLFLPSLPTAGLMVPSAPAPAGVTAYDHTWTFDVAPVDGGSPGLVDGKFPFDQRDPQEVARIEERLRLLQAGNTIEADLLAKTGTERLLVILVDFAGTDVVTWTAPITPSDPTTGSQWDPYGYPDPNEFTGVTGDCSLIITQTTRFTYSGPLHNDIQRPLSADDRAAHAIWTEDFNPNHYMQMLFGDGVLISYTAANEDPVVQDLRGYSLRNFYWLESGGLYTVTGDVLGWVSVPHSLAWYGADTCPGRRSGGGGSHNGGMYSEGGGNVYTMIRDAIDVINTTQPNFNWARYDGNGDGVLDRVLIVHAWIGEEDSPTLLDRTTASGSYLGELTLWSHKSAVNLEVAPGLVLGPYTLMPENGGSGVFAHEYAHDIGTMDLYSYGGGETSAGFWTLMADDWGGGDPYGAVPPQLDPMHRNWEGWLNPTTWDTTMPATEYLLGESSNPPAGMERALILEIPDQIKVLPVSPYSGSYYYYGGATHQRNAIIVLSPTLDLSTCTTATLSMMAWWDIEDCWDFGFVQSSTDGGLTWRGITGTHTTRGHDPKWYFTEDDLPGLTGYADTANTCGPDHAAGWQPLVYTLTQFCGSSVDLRIRYGTDWAALGGGWYIDDIAIDTDAGRVFFDDLEGGEGHWINNGLWYYSDGQIRIPHRYYVEWRNRDGFDRGLVEGRYGINDFGMLIWYNNDAYGDNEIRTTIEAMESPTFGPKGRLLVVDSHFAPWRDPDFTETYLTYGWEETNLLGRIQPRDAAFSLNDTMPFTNTYYDYFETTVYPSRPAVSAFHDSLGYYPGIELAYGSPYFWTTRDWDASVVVPARQDYTIAPTAFTNNRRILLLEAPGTPPYWQTGDDPTWSYPPMVSPWSGGTGNPGEYNFGLHVKILEQAPDMSWARVLVWYDPSTFVGDLLAKPQGICAGQTSTFYLTLKDSASYTYHADVAVTLPPSLTLVSGSLNWSGTMGGQVLDTPDGVLSFTVQVDPAASYGTYTVLANVVGDMPTKTYTLTAGLEVGPRFVGDATAPEFIHAGDLFTYTIAMGNEGCAAYGPYFLDNLPGEVDFITATNGAVYDPVEHTVSWHGEELGPGASRTWEVVVQAHVDTRPGTTIDNLVEFGTLGAGTATSVYAWSLVQPFVPPVFKIYLPLVVK